MEDREEKEKKSPHIHFSNCKGSKEAKSLIICMMKCCKEMSKQKVGSREWSVPMLLAIHPPAWYTWSIQAFKIRQKTGDRQQKGHRALFTLSHHVFFLPSPAKSKPPLLGSSAQMDLDLHLTASSTLPANKANKKHVLLLSSETRLAATPP